MFGFPVNLQDSSVQRLTNDADNSFPKIQQREIFYSVKDGVWNDETIWQTASGRVGKIPTLNDDVYIKNIVTTPNGQYGFSCHDLNITGTLTANPGTYGGISISGSIFCKTGFINLPINGGNYFYLRVYGNNSEIKKSNYIPGSAVVFSYDADIDQDILDLNYTNLGSASLHGIKWLRNDLSISHNLSLDNIGAVGTPTTRMECGPYNLTINGTTFVRGHVLSKCQPGNLLFVGNCSLRGANNLGFRSFDFSGNPNVEFRGGLEATTNSSSINSGTGTWRFTTNNQNFFAFNVGGGFGTGIVCPIMIANGITLTMTGSIGGFNFENYVNGEGATSKFVMGSGASLNFATQVAAENSMTTGIVDFTTFANTIYFSGNYTATITPYFPTFHNLTIAGTGTKSLGVNTTTNGNLDLQGNYVVGQAGILECGTFNLSVTGQTFVGSDRGKGAQFKKSGAGNLLFVGFVNTDNLGSQINLSGNPNVEMRGGYNNETSASLVSGTGTWTFSTNNQSITGGYSAIFYNNVFINGAITITNSLNMGIVGSLDGNNANSKWVLNGILDLYSPNPFATLGILDYTTNTNASVGFRYNGNLTLPGTTFQGLRIGGTGIKTLAGNTLVQRTLDVIGNYTPGAQGYLECSTFDLQVNGVTNVGSDQGKGATFSKTGAGNLLFIGALTSSNGGDRFLLPGNPTIEFRNGMSGFSPTSYNFGTGLITFTTNNQALIAYTNITYSNNFLISGSIIVETLSCTIVGVLNGSVSGSTFRIPSGNTIVYNNATQPMATGILDTSTNLNTWIYGSGNQDIKGGPTTGAKQVYRNLTLNGGGTKTLQGYVSVLNTYTLTSPATLANNGFTLTNP